MDLHEYELRTMSYRGFVNRFDVVHRNDNDIFYLVQKKKGGKLEKSLLKTSIDELRSLTRETYTQYKKNILQKSKNICITSSGKCLDVYIERLEYELKVIYEMGYNTYFLIVQDYINWARNNSIMVGPGRGSCAGSLLSYLIGITDIDPIQYDLIFERFLNPSRVSMPDIDTDFEDTLRDNVIEYIREKYGNEKVCHIGTYGTMAAKAAFKDVARVFGINFIDANKYSGLITEKTIQKSLENDTGLQNLYEQGGKIKKVIDIAKQLEGTVRQTGVHACGIIIAPQKTTSYTPIQYPPASGRKNTRDNTRIVSQYDGHVVEDIGLLKMDLLGLKNLSIIKNTIKIVNAKYQKEGKKMDPVLQDFMNTSLFHPPLNNQKTYHIFHEGNTSGVFQFESDGMRQWLKKLKPSQFDDLIAMVALYRPGPMEYIPHYIERKHGNEKVSYMSDELRNILLKKYGKDTAKKEKQRLHKDLSPFMDITYGIPVYQEQLMHLVQAMAGFTLAEADQLRRGVGKKIKELVEKIKGEFITKAQEKGYVSETAQWIYEHMVEPAADYSFNKSHAACYAYISYQTAWLKANYPLEFHAALLRSCEEDTDRLAQLINEIKFCGFEVSAPDVNSSFEHIAAIDNAIVLGFLSIKGIGGDIAKYIEDERKRSGKFTSLHDFIVRCSDYINKKSLEALIQSGSLDSLEPNRGLLWHNIGYILDRIKTKNKHQSMGGGLFDIGDVEGSSLRLLAGGEEFSFWDHLKQEFNIFKTFFSRHPFDGIYEYVKKIYNFISMVKSRDNFGEFRILGIIKDINRGMKGGFFLQVEDISGEMEFFVTHKLDMQIFDIVEIKAEKKGRFIRVHTIAVYEREHLISRAKKANMYNDNETVSRIRKKRFLANFQSGGHDGDISIVSHNFQSCDIHGDDNGNEDVYKVKVYKTSSETCGHDIGKTNGNNGYKNFGNTIHRTESGGFSDLCEYSFFVPDNVQILYDISQVLKKYPGKIEVKIGDLKKKVNKKGLALICEILKKDKIENLSS